LSGIINDFIIASAINRDLLHEQDNE